LNVGDTFYFNHALAHRPLWIVAGGPSPDGEFAIFNLTTVQPGCDMTCVLGPGDHPSITRPTYVTYLRGRALPGSLEGSQAHQFAWQQNLGAEALRRVQDGALASPHTSGKLQEIVRNTLNI
jgi:hypothetical protein